MDMTEIKYWYVVDWVNENAKRSKGYLKPKLYGIYGSKTKDDREIYCYDEKKKDFVLNYTQKLLLVNKGQIAFEDTLKDELTRLLNEFKAQKFTAKPKASGHNSRFKKDGKSIIK